MTLVFKILGYAAAIFLQIAIIHSLRRGGVRDSGFGRYPFLFLYVLADFVTNLVEIEPNLAYANGSLADRRRWAWIYWTDEQIIQAMLFVLVISLVYRASAGMRQRRILVAGLISGSILFAGISLAIHYSPDMVMGKWMTPWTRDMNFAAAILDLWLWAMLIRSRKNDTQLLLVTGALGIQFAAGAMGQALREISRDTIGVTRVLMVVANLACLYIWWHAFRSPQSPSQKKESHAHARGSPGGPI